MLTFELAPSDERPAALTTELRDLVDRFEHASGLTARFVAAGNVDRPSAYAHHEIVRIVEESLLNVHRHSGARQVLVRLAEKADHWDVSVEDDGRGFDFEGPVTQEELDRIGKGPRIIKQRVRLLGGSLTIESNPGVGAKLTIHAAFGTSDYAAQWRHESLWGVTEHGSNNVPRENLRKNS